MTLRLLMTQSGHGGVENPAVQRSAVALCAIVGRAIAMGCTKNERLSVSIPLIQQAKIQAQVLVPLVKALQAELGEERATPRLRGPWGDVFRRYGEDFGGTKNE